jgi:hypothetical protein
MARAVALKLQSESALAVVVRASGRGIVVEAVVPVPLADGDPPETVGEKIASALEPFSPGRAPTVVAVPRSELHWANYDLPPSPAGELPDLVQLQAQRDLVIADDGVGFDFVSLHGNEHHPHRVLGIGVSPAQLERIKSACSTAELKLQRIVPEPFGWVELGRRVIDGETDNGAGSLTVFAAMAGRQATVWATEDGALRLLRTVWLPAEPDESADRAALAGELRRTLLSLSELAGAPAASLPCVYCGAHADRVARELSALLARPVRAALLEEFMEAPSAHDGAAELAPLATLAAATAADRVLPIDLLHPHRPPAPPSRRRTYALASAAAGLVVLLLAWTAYRKVQGPLEAAAAADAERTKLAPTLQRLAVEEEKAAAVDAWLGQSINVLTELNHLAQQLRPKPLSDGEFNSGEDLIVTKLTITGRQLAIDAAARSTEALAAIERRLREGQYRVSRGVVESQTGDATPGYAARISGVLEHIEPAAATAASPAPPGETPS